MLFLRLDQALELLRACHKIDPRLKNPKLRKQLILKRKLAVRYFMYNGLSPMELANARIEHLDPVNRELFLPRRHWKDNQVTDIDPETVRLQIMYSGNRKKGPLLISRKTQGHFARNGLWDLIKRIAAQTNILGKQQINPLILKRTFARIFLKTPGNTVAALQKAFSHKHLWSTAHYLRFVLDDVRREKGEMMKRVEHAKTKQSRLVSR